MDVKPKRIAVVCDYKITPNRVGGMDRFFVAYDRKLKQSGCEVHWYFSSVENFDFYNQLMMFDAKNNGVESFFINTIVQNKLVYDVLVTHFVSLCTPFFQNAKKNGIHKIIATDHNARPLEGVPLKKGIKNKIKGLLYSKYIDVFVGVSHYTKYHILNDYGKYLESKTKVIYNGIDVEVFNFSEIKTSPIKFVVVSHLTENKGIQDLITAIDALPEEIKNAVKVDVYGEGPFEQELKQRITHNNLALNFNFKGSVSNINEILCQYNYLLQPTYMECFSLSILESLAANVPVITTNVGGNEEVIEHGVNGFIFPVKDVLALTNLLQKIMTNQIKINNNTRSLIISNFSIGKMVENHSKLIIS